MDDAFREDSLDALVRRVLDAADDRLRLFNPPPELLTAVSRVVHATRPALTIEVLAAAAVVDAATEQFDVATMLQDLLEGEQVALHGIDHQPSATYLVSGDRVVLPVILDAVFGVAVRDSTLAAAFTEYFEDRVATADPISLRTPGFGTIISTLQAEFDEAVATDFEALIRAASDQPDPVNAVAAALLVGARHDLLFYDLSRWGEDIGLASKATFSRTKTRLEERGLLATEKVPIDLGRPRLRLQVGPALADEPMDPEAVVRAIR